MADVNYYPDQDYLLIKGQVAGDVDVMLETKLGLIKTVTILEGLAFLFRDIKQVTYDDASTIGLHQYTNLSDGIPI